ncbi:MAG: hypothetical protein FWD61_11745 [Phycisphaerales bacterium]|nr:hypothetical protein [Phycisphaerales bacterium]
MTTLHAHFDGRVFVPDEPVNIPKNTPVKIQVQETVASEVSYGAVEVDPRSGLPIFKVPPGTKTITFEDIQRDLDEP